MNGNRSPIAAGAAALALLGVLGTTGTASAWFKVCNQSGQSITFAYATVDSANCSWGANGGTGCGGYSKHGWWNIPTNSCQIVWSGSALNRNFYWYAQSYDASLKWTSSSYSFQHTSAAHDQCFDLNQTNLNRCLSGTYYFEPQYPYYNHRTLYTTGTDTFFTLVK